MNPESPSDSQSQSSLGGAGSNVTEVGHPVAADTVTVAAKTDLLSYPVLSARPRILEVIDVLLKTPDVLFGESKLLGILFGILLFGHLLFGVIVGSFSGAAQWLAAPAKIVLGTLAAGLLCLPSLYIFACLSGARIKLRDVISLLCSALALTSVMLLGFAPVVFVFTFSTDSLVAIGVLHITIWLIAIAFGIRFVIRGVTASGGHATGFARVWALIFLLCLLQMSTTLRPILGHSDNLLSSEKQFFIRHWLEQIHWEKSKAGPIDPLAAKSKADD